MTEPTKKQLIGPQIPEGRKEGKGGGCGMTEEFRRAGEHGEGKLAKVLNLVKKGRGGEEVVRKARLTVIIACLDPDYASEASVEKVGGLAKVIFDDPRNYWLIFEIYADDPERFGPAIVKEIAKRPGIARRIVEECAREAAEKMKAEQRKDARARLGKKLELAGMIREKWESGL